MDKRSQKSINDQRSKEQNRSYGCPCGKTYLSYPALFTHVKQKHEGKAPGKLIKPKTGKIRGRPKTKINPADVELEQINDQVEHDIAELLEGIQIEYNQQFQRSGETSSCQDAASIFIDHFEERLGERVLPLLNYFLNEVKGAVDQKYGVQYWIKEKPKEIIQVANEIYVRHELNENSYKVKNQVFKELIFNFFEWLYANKFTDHRLKKKGVSQQDKTKANE